MNQPRFQVTPLTLAKDQKLAEKSTELNSNQGLFRRLVGKGGVAPLAGERAVRDD
jgi:hypothetical protein